MLIFPVVVTLAGGRPRDCSSDRRRARLRLAIACLKVEAKVLGAQSLGHIWYIKVNIYTLSCRNGAILGRQVQNRDDGRLLSPGRL